MVADIIYHGLLWLWFLSLIGIFAVMQLPRKSSGSRVWAVRLQIYPTIAVLLLAPPVAFTSPSLSTIGAAVFGYAWMFFILYIYHVPGSSRWPIMVIFSVSAASTFLLAMTWSELARHLGILMAAGMFVSATLMSFDRELPVENKSTR